MKPIFFALSVVAITVAIGSPTAAQQNLCSKDIDGKEVNLKVVNKTDKPFTVNWVDPQCKEGKSDQQIAPGATFEGVSYNGHAFRVREVGTNRLLQVIVANPSNPVTIVNAAPTAAVRPPSTPPPTPAASPAGRPSPPAVGATKFPIPAGTTLKRGVKYLSSSGNHHLIFADDGNLVVKTKGDQFIWGLNLVSKNFSQSDRVEVLPEGRIAVYDAKGKALWTSSGNPAPNATLNLTFSGVLQLVSATGEILWSSDGILAASLRVFIDKPNAKPCTPEPGWVKCLELPDPTIKIMGSRAVTQSAMNGVANIYTEITKRFGPKYPRSQFNGFKIYLTNGEPWSELRKLSAIAVRPEKPYETSDDFYRGFGGADTLWITEQMICKTGVKTRNETGIIPDNQARTLDQVVHEFGHSIDFKYISDQTMNLFGGAISPVEGFAYGIQFWFGAPGGTLTPKQEAVLKELFTSRATFSCEGYRP